MKSAPAHARRRPVAATEDDAGTLLGDRKYRPDVEGLRAVAVVAVILFHTKIAGFTGGFVGVDVFYVISGFVITGVLLRKVESSGSPGFGDFYARRARRILPAAGLVLVVTVLASYHWLGFVRGAEVADDARWCAVFLGNFHFLSIGTNYFSSQLPPSPLQNYWSLGVEEQFYLVYPLGLALSLLVIPKVSVRLKVMIFTAAVIAGSLWWSIHETSAAPYSAYLSSLTRAWELALGGFMARDRRHPLCGPSLHQQHCVSRLGRPGACRQCRAHHRRRHVGRPLGRRAHTRDRGLPLGGQALVLSLPVELACAHHRRTGDDEEPYPRTAGADHSGVPRPRGCDVCAR